MIDKMALIGIAFTEKRRAGKAAALRTFHVAHPEYQRAYCAQYHLEHKEELKAYRDARKGIKKITSAVYRTTHKDETKARSATFQIALKLAALNAYGGPICVCCGETLFEGLSIDHIDGGGTVHRKEIGRAKLYIWLKDNNYPPGYQVLCMTCNFAKRGHDHCPHKEKPQ